MPSIAAPRPRRCRSRSGSRGLPWLIVVFLLLKSAVPLLAAVAAQARGIAVAEVCPVYGVATLPMRAASALSAHDGMAGMDVAGAGGAAAEPAHHASGSDHRHDHHGDTAATHDHCVLTPLLGAAALAASGEAALRAVLGTPLRGISCSSPNPPHDQALAWYARGAHPPPA